MAEKSQGLFGGPNIFDEYAKDAPSISKATGATQQAKQTSAFRKPSGKKKAGVTAKKSSKTKRPRTSMGEPDEEGRSPLATGLKAAMEGMAYIPATGGTASSLLRSMVGGAYAGQSIVDAVRSARKTHERLSGERSSKNTKRSMSDESVGHE
jgi:hypothetical protein